MADEAETRPAATAPTSRLAYTHFKGVEMYSWRSRAAGSWHFALLVGTNRNKGVAEVLRGDVRIDGPAALKERLGGYAPREQAFWHRGVSGPGDVPPDVEFGYPDAALVKALQGHCRRLDIDLHILGR